MAWTIVVTDLAGEPKGELRNASSRKVRRALNRVSTLELTIRVDNPLADDILNAQVLFKVYDDNALRFVGQLVTAEEVSQDQRQSIAITAADPFWRLQHRLIGKTAAGYTNGTATSPIDKSLLLRNIVTTVNADAFTGITIGTVTNAGATGYVAYSPFKVAGEAVAEISAQLDGPDFELAPTEPTAVTGGTQIALLNVSGAIGAAKPDAVFEYGVGRRNVVGFQRSVGLDGLLNKGYSPPPGSNPSAATLVASDPTSQSTYGLAEGVISADLPVDSLRQSLLNEHVRVRKNPRQLITFTPSRDDPARPGRVPQYGTDFVLGDTVPFRAVVPLANGSESLRVNASLRVFAIEWNINEEGAAIPSFTLTES